MKASMVFSFVVHCLLLVATARSSIFTQPLSMTDSFLINPFYTSNATIYHESFAPNVRYWDQLFLMLRPLLRLSLTFPSAFTTPHLKAASPPIRWDQTPTLIRTRQLTLTPRLITRIGQPLLVKRTRTHFIAE